MLYEVITATEIVAHRVIWSVLFLAVLLVLRRQMGAVRAVFGNRRLLAEARFHLHQTRF